jgi:acylphosphatase
MADDRQAVRVHITGRVQGVNFRGWTRGQAARLGLDGWVRNEADGSVRALLAGPRAKLEDMIARLHSGPSAARVTKVVVEAADAEGVAVGFAILH